MSVSACIHAEDEPVQERQLKLQIIEIYNSKLDERIYRKNTIIGRQGALHEGNSRVSQERQNDWQGTAAKRCIVCLCRRRFASAEGFWT